MNISLVHATRSRPIKAYKVFNHWLSTADNPAQYEHIFCFDDDDQTVHELREPGYKSISCPADGGYVTKFNKGFSVAKGQVLVGLADDYIPFKGWDTILYGALINHQHEPKVLHVNDGVETGKLMTIQIMNRKRYEQIGYLHHPLFKINCCDAYYSHCAYRDGVVLERRDILIKHEWQTPLPDHLLTPGYRDSVNNAPDTYKELMKDETYIHLGSY